VLTAEWASVDLRIITYTFPSHVKKRNIASANATITM
jgi:hypothetical protein